MGDDCLVVEVHDLLPLQQRECYSVVLELGVLLQETLPDFCLVGGWAVYALTEYHQRRSADASVRHRGSMDVDVAVGWAVPERIEQMVRLLRSSGYVGPDRFQWFRELLSGNRYRVDMMALPPAGHPGGAVSVAGYEFAPLWDGDIAVRFRRPMLLRGHLPTGQVAEATVYVAGLAGLLVTKVKASLGTRGGPVAKHVYDLFTLIRTFPGGPPALAQHLTGSLDAAVLDDLTDYLEALFGEGAVGPRLVADLRAVDGGDPDGYRAEASLWTRRLLRELQRR